MGTAGVQAPAEQRVLIYPAQTPMISNRQIYFLFSLLQMEDILMDVAVQPVPFSPPYIEGVAEWQDNVLPVLSLEQCLGLASDNTGRAKRLMVVRAARKADTPVNGYRSMLRVVPSIRMVTLPIPCTPVSVEWLPEQSLVRGVYEWEKGFLVVVKIDKSLLGGNGGGN